MNIAKRLLLYGGGTFSLPPFTAEDWSVEWDGAVFDPDAAAYIARVETADGQSLEPAVKTAINDFVVGVKADGDWSALKASCILAGARTLDGALEPLVGVAPTSFNFVGTDYNRKTGLKGDEATKYLNSNRNNNADPQNSQHMAVFPTLLTFGNRLFLSSATTHGQSGSSEFADSSSGAYMVVRSRSDDSVLSDFAMTENTLSGFSRSNSSNVNARVGGVTVSKVLESQTPQDGEIHVFSRRDGGHPTASRISFYSTGENINLANVDTRVTALMNAINTAI